MSLAWQTVTCKQDGLLLLHNRLNWSGVHFYRPPGCPLQTSDHTLLQKQGLSSVQGTHLQSKPQFLASSMFAKCVFMRERGGGGAVIGWSVNCLTMATKHLQRWHTSIVRWTVNNSPAVWVHSAGTGAVPTLMVTEYQRNCPTFTMLTNITSSVPCKCRFSVQNCVKTKTSHVLKMGMLNVGSVFRTVWKQKQGHIWQMGM